MSINNRAMLALIVAGTLSVTACTSKVPAASEGSVEKAKYQVVASGNTEERLDVVNVAVSTSGDTARASVELRNDSSFNYNFEYRFKWYDAAGVEISPEASSWMPVAIMANETRSVQSLAPGPDGATFKLFLQEKQ